MGDVTENAPGHNNYCLPTESMCIYTDAIYDSLFFHLMVTLMQSSFILYPFF